MAAVAGLYGLGEDNRKYRFENIKTCFLKNFYDEIKLNLVKILVNNMSFLTYCLILQLLFLQS